MAKADRFEVEGTVVEKLKGGKFIVKVNELDIKVECTISGKLRINYINILVGDRVTIDISPSDTTKGRIVWRNK